MESKIAAMNFSHHHGINKIKKNGYFKTFNERFLKEGKTAQFEIFLSLLLFVIADKWG